MTQVAIDQRTRDVLYEAVLAELGALSDVHLLLEKRNGSWVEARDLARRMRQCFRLFDLISWQKDPGNDGARFQIEDEDRVELDLLMGYFWHSAEESLKELGDEDERLTHAVETARADGLEAAKEQWRTEKRCHEADMELIEVAKRIQDQLDIGALA